VPLFSRRLLIFVENPVNELLYRTQFRLFPLGVLRSGGIALSNAWRTIRRCTL
jgi:hypothetical protein